MPMLSSSGVMHQISAMVRKLKDGYEIELKTFKKDRGIEIWKEGDSIVFEEFGFRNERHTSDPGIFEKAFREIYEREFPRSHEVRVSIRRRK